MSEKRTIGTCGNCGGPVQQYLWLHTTGPFPPAKCAHCGAIPKHPYGERIEMEPAPRPNPPELDRFFAWRVAKL